MKSPQKEGWPLSVMVWFVMCCSLVKQFTRETGRGCFYLKRQCLYSHRNPQGHLQLYEPRTGTLNTSNLYPFFFKIQQCRFLAMCQVEHLPVLLPLLHVLTNISPSLIHGQTSLHVSLQNYGGKHGFFYIHPPPHPQNQWEFKLRDVIWNCRINN